jgi:hypothetical protein
MIALMRDVVTNAPVAFNEPLSRTTARENVRFLKRRTRG